jgi:hypothetical protein
LGEAGFQELIRNFQTLAHVVLFDTGTKKRFKRLLYRIEVGGVLIFQ